MTSERHSHPAFLCRQPDTGRSGVSRRVLWSHAVDCPIEQQRIERPGRPSYHLLVELWGRFSGQHSGQPNARLFGYAGVPTGFVVTLTVTDSGGLSAQATLNVSVNNTPPNVTITSPVNGTLFNPNVDTTVNLIATRERHGVQRRPAAV